MCVSSIWVSLFYLCLPLGCQQDTDKTQSTKLRKLAQQTWASPPTLFPTLVKAHKLIQRQTQTRYKDRRRLKTRQGHRCACSLFDVSKRFRACSLQHTLLLALSLSLIHSTPPRSLSALLLSLARSLSVESGVRSDCAGAAAHDGYLSTV
jgi:hypothetical protein